MSDADQEPTYDADPEREAIEAELAAILSGELNEDEAAEALARVAGAPGSIVDTEEFAELEAIAAAFEFHGGQAESDVSKVDTKAILLRAIQSTGASPGTSSAAPILQGPSPAAASQGIAWGRAAVAAAVLALVAGVAWKLGSSSKPAADPSNPYGAVLGERDGGSLHWLPADGGGGVIALHDFPEYYKGYRSELALFVERRDAGGVWKEIYNGMFPDGGVELTAAILGTAGGALRARASFPMELNVPWAIAWTELPLQ